MTSDNFAPQPGPEIKLTGLDLLRAPFPAHQISKRPNPTKAQTDAVRATPNLAIRCQECGSWHHRDSGHLDYVGHAALTNRLLDCDPEWNWEPLSFGPDGLPKFDESGGLWIKLTVCGVTRLGYGNAQSSNFKEVGAREKEVIGDALRNAAMRGGAALELWHKGDLHLDDIPPPSDKTNIADKPHMELLASAEAMARKGLGAYRDFWKKLSTDERNALGAHSDHLKSIVDKTKP